MESIRPLIKKAKTASGILRSLDVNATTSILGDMAETVKNNREMLIKLNKQDVENGKAMHLSPLMMERLQLDKTRLTNIAGLLQGLSETADLSLYNRQFKRSDKNLFTYAPEVMGIIYESCPFITAVSAGLSIKAGSIVILRGGKEAFHTNTALASILSDVLEKYHLPREIITLIPSTDRVLMAELIRLSDLVDIIVPQGSEGLIQYVTNNSLIPVIRGYNGLFNLCVDREIEIDKAIKQLLSSDNSAE
ncbi:MAG: hypothetical protein R6V48_03085 [Fidelibacterota bacterium]